MKKYLVSISIAALLATAALGQRTPQASPSASVMQTVGVTDFSVKYSRPSLKGRTVFKDSAALAPYNELWRTGANMATVFESNTDFTFGEKKVPAGKYALFSIPGGAAWTVILNKNFTQGGTADYKESEDVARVMVVPVSSAFTESFTIDFSPVTDSTTTLNLSWSSVRVPVQMMVNTQDLTMTALNKAVAEKPEDVGVLQSTAGYLLSKGKDLPIALSLADKAIGLKESYSNLWIKAQILNKMGKIAEALPVAEKAITLGTSANDNAFNTFYKGQIEKGISDMKAKAPAAKQAVNDVNGKKKRT